MSAPGMSSQLASSEEKFEAISAAMLDALIVVDNSDALVYWNPAAERLLGYRADEVIGRPLHQLLTPQRHKDAGVQGFNAFRGTGQGAVIGKTIEIEALHKDGHEIPVQLSISTLKLDGRWHAVGILRDITELKRDQEALQRLNRELRAISNCSQTLTRAENEQALLDDICRIVCDQAGYRMAWVGYAENDDAKTVRPVAWAGNEAAYLANANITWSDTEHGRGPTGAAIRSGKTACVQDFANDPQAVPWRGTALQRGYRSSIALPLQDAGARTFGALTIYSTEPNAFTADEMRLLEELAGDLAFGIVALRTRAGRKRVEEEIGNAQKLSESIIRNSPVGILSTGMDGTITGVNSAALEILGSPSEEKTKQFNVLTLESMVKQGISDVFARCLKNGETIIDETMEYTSMWGKRLYISLGIVPWMTTDNRQIGSITMLNDVTERKRLEEQLRQSQKMEVIGRLAGGVAHDFNNLLTAINGYAEILAAGMAPGDQRLPDVEEIRKAGERAAALTRQLLAFSRRQVLQSAVIDLNDVVAGIAPMLRRLVGEQIELRALQTPDLGCVRADPSQVEQVLLNLVVNARDAMPAGGTLTIETANIELDDEYARTHPLVAPGRYVLLAVSDTGTGMDETTMAHLFEPFFTTKALGEGTGLGLATAYGIVSQSGGHVTAYSEPGHGSVFKVFLPRVAETVEPHTPALAEPAASGAETILLVEDEDAVRSFVERVLGRLGYTVTTARSGAEALALVADHPGPIDLLVTDVMLPGMNGREISERLTALRPSLRTLFISGYTEDSIVHRGELDPGVAFLGKPFTPDALGHAVREVLGAQKVVGGGPDR